MSILCKHELKTAQMKNLVFFVFRVQCHQEMRSMSMRGGAKF